MPRKPKKRSSTKAKKAGKKAQVTPRPKVLKKKQKTNSPFVSFIQYLKHHLALIVFLVGAFCFGAFALYHTEQLINLTFYRQQLPIVQKHRTSLPVRIHIQAVDIDLPIYETVISNNTWQIADNGISHLAVSARPGENGTIIIYGHNTNDRFGPIRWLNLGDTINITTADKKLFVYKISNIQTVDPTNTYILTSQKGSTLILYTCTGFADLKRYVIIAKPTK